MPTAGYDPELERIVRELNEKVDIESIGSGTVVGRAARREPMAAAAASSLDQLLRYASAHGASDVILVAGSGLILRKDGVLLQSRSPLLTDEDIRSLILPLLTPNRQEELERERSLDFSFWRDGIGRFRTNIHFQRGTVAVAIRLLPAEIPTLESLHLPVSMGKLLERRQGLVLLTGPTGSGKTSTLAALMGMINQQHAFHVVTIEDPIEYYHANRRSVFEQIEVGHDAIDFARSLRSVLRQSPDVILLGEMRDPETMAAALTAAETGHLVFSTLHTNDTMQAIGRIVDVFPSGRQNQVRQQLSLALLAIIAQQLVPAANGVGRYPAVEILLANTAVRHLIRKGEDHLLRSQLSLGRSEGMVMMEQSLADLVHRGLITEETAAAHCFRTDELRRYLEL
jgi:twitching motility protein PilT